FRRVLFRSPSPDPYAQHQQPQYGAPPVVPYAQQPQPPAYPPPPAGPSHLPPGWTSFWDGRHNAWFYVDPNTRLAQWAHPHSYPEPTATVPAYADASRGHGDEYYAGGHGEAGHYESYEGEEKKDKGEKEGKDKKDKDKKKKDKGGSDGMGMVAAGVAGLAVGGLAGAALAGSSDGKSS